MDDFVVVAVGGEIVQKAVSRVEIMLGGGRLIGGELTDSREDGKVQGSRIEEQGPNYLLAVDEGEGWRKRSVGDTGEV